MFPELRIYRFLRDTVGLTGERELQAGRHDRQPTQHIRDTFGAMRDVIQVVSCAV